MGTRTQAAPFGVKQIRIGEHPGWLLSIRARFEPQSAKKLSSRPDGAFAKRQPSNQHPKTTSARLRSSCLVTPEPTGEK